MKKEIQPYYVLYIFKSYFKKECNMIEILLKKLTEEIGRCLSPENVSVVGKLIIIQPNLVDEVKISVCITEPENSAIVVKNILENFPTQKITLNLDNGGIADRDYVVIDLKGRRQLVKEGDPFPEGSVMIPEDYY